jgi:hypothetical protein
VCVCVRERGVCVGGRDKSGRKEVGGGREKRDNVNKCINFEIENKSNKS